MIISVVGGFIPRGREEDILVGRSPRGRSGGRRFHWPAGSSGRRDGSGLGQPVSASGGAVSGASAWSACKTSAVNGAVAARCSSRRRPVRAWRAGIESSRRRSRLGSQRRGSWPGRGGGWLQGGRAPGTATMGDPNWVCAEVGPRRGGGDPGRAVSPGGG